MPPVLLPILVRLGVAALAGYAAGRLSRMRGLAYAGRTDQRAEEALDALDEGLAFHRPPDGAAAVPGPRQSNASLRLRRAIGFRGREWELDAGVIARLRLRERQT